MTAPLIVTATLTATLIATLIATVIATLTATETRPTGPAATMPRPEAQLR